MTRDDIHRMAWEAAGGILSYDAEGNWRLSEAEVERFAELVRQHTQIKQMPKFEELATLVAERDTALLRQALEALESVYPYTDSLICYASTVDEHPPNAIDGNVRDALTALRERLGEKK